MKNLNIMSIGLRPVELKQLRRANELETGSPSNLRTFTSSLMAVAFLRATAQPHDLIVIDSDLPMVSIRTAVFELRKVEISRKVPVAVIGGRGTEPQTISAAKVDYFLPRPADLHDLRLLIRRISARLLNSAAKATAQQGPHTLSFAGRTT
jgi:DNA-binding response OmpR family regulator